MKFVDISVSIRAALCLALAWTAPAGFAAPGIAHFQVSAALVSGPLQLGFCATFDPLSETFGAVVVVVCSTGKVVDVIAPNAEKPGIDSYLGWGALTAWRWVSLADRHYLELQLGW